MFLKPCSWFLFVFKSPIDTTGDLSPLISASGRGRVKTLEKSIRRKTDQSECAVLDDHPVGKDKGPSKTNKTNKKTQTQQKTTNQNKRQPKTYGLGGCGGLLCKA